MILRSLSAAAIVACAAPALSQPAMPGPGDPLPDIAVHDDQGQEFQLRRLRGEHAVIVFGCLT